MIILLLIYASSSQFRHQTLISCTLCMTEKWSKLTILKDFAGVNKIICQLKKKS